MKDNIFYVYAWVREDYNTIFYVGKGKNDAHHNRANTIKNNKHFKNIYNKHKTHVIILQNNLSEQEALQREKDVISFLVNIDGYSIGAPNHKKKKIQGRHLVNCTFGGEGVSGYKHTEETKEKTKHYGEDNWMYGRKGELCPHYGKSFTYNHKEKIKLSNPRRKPVKCIEFNIIANSFREMSKILLNKFNVVCSHASISANVRDKIKFCGYEKDTKEELHLHFILLNE